MGEGVLTLRHAVRPRVLGKYLGQLGLMLALLTLAPLIASLYFAEFHLSARYLQVEAVLVLVSLLLNRLPAPSQLQQNEALAIVALAFILSPLIMLYPMLGTGLTPAQALFESVSAVTTTGLSSLASVHGSSPTFLFTRAWMQWYGGLGIVALSIALLLGHHIASRRLAEPLATEGLATTTRRYARQMLAIYLLLTTLSLGLMLLAGMSGFDALLHTLSGVSTGGFSPHDSSLAALGMPHQALLVVLIGLCGAIPFHLYYALRQQGLTPLTQDMELRSLLLLALLATCALTLLMHRQGIGWHGAFYHGVIQALSALSTSGFASLDISTLDQGSKLTLIFTMFIGGGVGSTAGGIKILRLLILLRLLQLLLQRTTLPSHAISTPQLAGRNLEAGEIQNALMLILLFLLVVALSWLAFVLHGYPPLDALFEVVSATATVGLSSGLSGPGLEPLLQGVLMLDMLLGRLEIVALLVVLYPPTWFGKRMEL